MTLTLDRAHGDLTVPPHTTGAYVLEVTLEGTGLGRGEPPYYSIYHGSCNLY